MSESTLLELYNALNAAQLRSVRFWVASPLFNRREEPLRLFDYLESCRKNDQKCQKKAAIDYVFGVGKGSDGQLRHEMSALKGLLQDFLVWQETQNNQAPALTAIKPTAQQDTDSSSDDSFFNTPPRPPRPRQTHAPSTGPSTTTHFASSPDLPTWDSDFSPA